MHVNNNLYYVVGNLVTETYIFSRSYIYVWPVEESVSLANSPYFPLSSIIPFVQLPHIFQSFTFRYMRESQVHILYSKDIFCFISFIFNVSS